MRIGKALAEAKANQEKAEVCESCGVAVEIGSWPFCGGDPTKHAPLRPHRPFIPFTIEHEGRSYYIDGAVAAAKMAAETERIYRDGRGSPIAMRDFNMDASNRDRNCFGENPVSPISNPFTARTTRGLPVLKPRGPR